MDNLHLDLYFSADNQDAVKAYHFLQKLGRKRTSFIISLVNSFVDNQIGLDADSLTKEQVLAAATLYVFGSNKKTNKTNTEEIIHGEQKSSRKTKNCTKERGKKPTANNAVPEEIPHAPAPTLEIHNEEKDTINSGQEESEELDMDLLNGLSLFYN